MFKEFAFLNDEEKSIKIQQDILKLALEKKIHEVPEE